MAAAIDADPAAITSIEEDAGATTSAAESVTMVTSKITLSYLNPKSKQFQTFIWDLRNNKP